MPHAKFQPGLNFLLAGKIAGVPCRVLIDTGASNTFIDKGFVEKYKLAVDPSKSYGVNVAGGTTALCSGTCRVKLALQSSTTNIAADVMPNVLDGVDLILGNDWLLAHKARLCFATHTCTLLSAAEPVVLRAPRVPDDSDSLVNPIALIDTCMALMRHKYGVETLISVKAADKLLRGGARRFLAYVKPQLYVPPDTADPSNKRARTAGQPFVASVTPDASVPPEIAKVVCEFSDVFEDVPAGLPPDRGNGHTIRLEPGAVPPYRPMYRLSAPEDAEARRQIIDLIAKGFIEPSASPYGAPILFVQKKDGTLRMCVDYRQLNKVTIRDRYPLPRIDDLFDKLAGSTVFSTLDLQSGYHQIRITPEDIPKTAFLTPMGQYQFKVLCFGLTNAPATFQRVMNQVFSKQMNKYLVCYLDDLCCHSPCIHSHAEHLRDVLTTLRENKLYAKFSKCEFGKSSLKFLGHIVSSDGIAADPDKVATIRDWPVPKNLKELQSFLGLANFFRRFVQGYSTLTAPLTDLCGSTTNHFPWDKWPTLELDAFNGVKHALTTAPVLAMPDFTKPFEVRTDASLMGTGGVLMQEGRPIAYMSKKFIPAERDYHTTDQELLVHACKEWRCYLEGSKALLITDHKSLEYFPVKPDLSRRQARWAEFMSRFDFEIQYQPGNLNVADPLSRNPILAVVISAVSAITRSQARAQPPAVPPVVTTNAVPPAQVLQPAGQSILPLPPAHPLTLRKQILNAYAADSRMQDPAFTSMFDQSAEGLYLSNGKVFVPDNSALKHAIFHEVHDAQYAGHVGITKTLERVARMFWWHTMRRDVEQYVKHCDTCQRNKPRNHKAHGHLQPLPVPGWRWESVSFDLIVKLPKTSRGNDSICVFVDRLSKMVHLAPCKESMKAPGFARLFVWNVYRLHGLPKTLISDRGTHWNNQFWHGVCELLGVEHRMSTAYHPQTDGQTERVNRTLEDMLHHYVPAVRRDWDDLLACAEFAINNSWQESIQNTPFWVNYGQHPVTPALFDVPRGAYPSAHAFSSAWQSAVSHAQKCMRAAQQRMADRFNANRPAVSFAPGDLVLLSTANLHDRLAGAKKFHPKFVGPMSVVEMVGKAAVRLFAFA